MSEQVGAVSLGCLRIFESGLYDFRLFERLIFSMVVAGVGGYSYLLEPLWWLGMITSELLFPVYYFDWTKSMGFCGIVAFVFLVFLLLR